MLLWRRFGIGHEKESESVQDVLEKRIVFDNNLASSLRTSKIARRKFNDDI